MQYLTRWTITVALGQIETETIGTALLLEVVLSSDTKASSLQQRIQLDFGGCAILTSRLQIRNATASVEHSQTDGVME